MKEIISHMDLGRGNETPKILRCKKDTSIVTMITLALIFTISFMVPAQHPQINDVYGVVLDGKPITITGSNFGAEGPNIVLFDDFKRGTKETPITKQASIGTWNDISTTYIPYFREDVKGNIAASLIGDNGGQLIVDFNDVQEVFISYRVIIPPGKHFPYSFAPNTFPAGSQWKLTWLMDGERGYMGNDDLCLPTWPNGTYFMVGGNDAALNFETGRKIGSTRWFSFKDWNRYSVYLKGGAIPDIDKGTIWSQGMSPEFGQKIFQTADKVLFDGDDTPDGYKFEDDAISRWNRFNVPGWSRNGDSNAAAMYDDIYIAAGANSRARIEIGNNNLYQDCTKLAILTPTSWKENVIKATIRQGIFQEAETAYLFVIDKNGNPSNGYPLAPGSPINVSSVSVTPPTKTLEVGQTQQLVATVLPSNATNKNVTWSSSNPTIASVSTSGKVTANAVGMATITVTTQDGNKTASSVVTVTTTSPTLTADAGQDKTLTCTTTQVTLGGANTSNGATYAWTTSNGNITAGGNTKNATVNKSGTYTLTVSKSGSTTVTDDVVVTEDKTPPTANAGADKTINSGESTQLTATGGGTYSWSPTTGLSNANVANPMASPTITTTYTVTVTGSNGCTASDQVKVTVNGTVDPCATPPTANAGEDVTIEEGSSTQLNATGGDTYVWSPTVGLNNANIATPEASPTTTITYAVTVTDGNGCTATDEVTITIVEKVFRISNNSFSPNGDNVNDVWHIEALQDKANYEMTIYNRWGNKVFTSDVGYNTPWDGMYQGKPLPTGTYFYILKLGDDTVIKGNVNIIK